MMRKRDDESSIEFLRRIVSWLNYEDESILEQLPSVQAILDYADLWSVYQTDMMCGIIEAIQAGDDPSPFADFIKKYNLPWIVPKKV